MSHTRRRHPALRVESEVRIADAVARSREAALKLEGHVRVGDHPPELRAACSPGEKHHLDGVSVEECFARGENPVGAHVPQFAQFKS